MTGLPPVTEKCNCNSAWCAVCFPGDPAAPVRELDLEAIKKRLKCDYYRCIEQPLDDVLTLIAEVESLRAAIHLRELAQAAAYATQQREIQELRSEVALWRALQ